MKTQESLIITQLDRKMRVLQPAKEPFAPPIGWIRAVRDALGIPRRVVAKKLGIRPQTLQGIEEREAEGTITLKTLRETAAAMDLELVYGFVPKDGSLRASIHRKAREAARAIVLRTAHTMSLEDQAISDRRVRNAIAEKTRELEETMPGYLWE